MRLGPGSRIGGYEVVSALGEGGMGEVYRALDTSLRRHVAIKLVHEAFCDRPDSLLRLRREARALAALNHPHIATLYELAEFDGGCGLVMELVDGETLAEILAARRLTTSDVLRLGTQIASALEAAHERGLVHRDLKPANIKITSDGAVKVLDFGLVKTEEPAAPAASTLATASGAVVGTAHYMSPEQARGSSVDRRTDLWAFGCVLYEMLAGKRAFAGPSATDVLVAVLDREPDWSALPADTPWPVQRLVRRCLQKDVRHRLRDAGDARLELEDAATADRPPQAVPTAAPAPTRSSWLWTAAGLGGAAALGAALAAAIEPSPPASVPPLVQFSITLADGERLGAVDLSALAVSPDGRLVTYLVERGGSTQLLLRRLDAIDSTPLPGTTNALSPFFSPDSRWIGFFANGQLKKVPVAGGPPVVICDAGGGFGASWGANGTIVFAPEAGSALQRVSADGGTPSPATTLDVARGEFSHRWPEFLPDGATVLFTVGTVGEWDEAEIVVQSLESGQRTTLVKGGTHPHYLSSGALAYAHAGAIWAAPLDLQPGRIAAGPGVRVLEGVTSSVDGAAQFAVSPAGVIVHRRETPGAAARRLVMVEGGEITPLAAAAHRYVTPRLSPDGRRVLIGVADDSEHIWAYDLGTSALTQITFDAANRAPIWTVDGQRVTFASNRNGALNLFVAPLDSPGSADRLTSSDALQLPGSWSPDGSVLAFMEQRPATGRDVWLLRRGGERTALAESAGDESAPRFSPDGRWIAYVSNESGQAEVFVRPSSGTGPARRVSASGGAEPVWRRDGGALYYRTDDRLMAVAVRAGLAAGAPRVVFDGPVERGTFDAAGYDALPGVDRFIMVTSAARNAAPTELQVAVNWTPALPTP